jgi:hypothetical protein
MESEVGKWKHAMIKNCLQKAVANIAVAKSRAHIGFLDCFFDWQCSGSNTLSKSQTRFFDSPLSKKVVL